MKVCGGKSCLLGNKPLKGYVEMLAPCFPWCPADIMRPVKISENAVSQASGTALLKGGIPDWAAHPSPTQVPSIPATAYDRPSRSRQVGSLHPEQLPSPSSQSLIYSPGSHSSTTFPGEPSQPTRRLAMPASGLQAARYLAISRLLVCFPSLPGNCVPLLKRPLCIPQT